MKKATMIFIGFIAAFSILTVMTYLSNWKMTLSILMRINLKYFAIAIGLWLLAVCCWLVEWRLAFFATNTKIRFLRVVKYYFISAFTNNITPFGNMGGEPAMAYILEKKEKIPPEKGFASIMFIDLVCILPIIVISLFSFISYASRFHLSEKFFRYVIVMFLLIALLGILLVVLIKKRDWILRTWLRISAGFKKIAIKFRKDTTKLEENYVRNSVKNFYHTIDLFSKNSEETIGMIVFSFIGWVILVFAARYAFMSIGLNISVMIIFLTYPIAKLASFLPLPGGLGGVEGSFVALLTFAGVNISFATAGVLMYRFIAYWLSTAIGAINVFTLFKEKKEYLRRI